MINHGSSCERPLDAQQAEEDGPPSCGNCLWLQDLVDEGSRRILGVHLVGPHVDEVINLLGLRSGMDLRPMI